MRLIACKFHITDLKEALKHFIARKLPNNTIPESITI